MVRGSGDCRCQPPRPQSGGTCRNCGAFACEFADRGQTRCAPDICDCFIEMFPDSPRALHPEAFIVGRREESHDEHQ